MLIFAGARLTPSSPFKASSRLEVSYTFPWFCWEPKKMRLRKQASSDIVIDTGIFGISFRSF